MKIALSSPPKKDSCSGTSLLYLLIGGVMILINSDFLPLACEFPVITLYILGLMNWSLINKDKKIQSPALDRRYSRKYIKPALPDIIEKTPKG